MQRKTTEAYYFSVEGETEEMYLDWLMELINNEPTAKYKVSIKSKVQKNPLALVKKLNVISRTEVTHLLFIFF